MLFRSFWIAASGRIGGARSTSACTHSAAARSQSATYRRVRRSSFRLIFALLIGVRPAHHNVYLSFATAITGRSPRFADLVRAVHKDRLLVESDGPAQFLDEWVSCLSSYL